MSAPGGQADVIRGKADIHLLVPDGSDGKLQARHKLPGMGTKRCYHLSAQIVSDEGESV